MKILLSATVALLASQPVAAYAYCSEPSAPYCSSQYGSFNDQWDFDRCKSEMESYQSDVEQFLSCNNRLAEEAIDDARRKNNDASSAYSDAVDSFNRRASN